MFRLNRAVTGVTCASALWICAVIPSVSFAQTEAKLALAQQFFDTHDQNGDTLLSNREFIEGFIAQSIEDRPTQTRLALVLFGRKRIDNCLTLGFERADDNGDSLMSLDELSSAYAREAFDDLGDMC